MRRHTVEKIGGTSMSNFDLLINNIFIGDRKGDELYNRMFVVSAYGGITNSLLEHKKSGKSGVYAQFAASDPNWKASLKAVEIEMCSINSSLAEKTSLDIEKANEFVKFRLSGIEACLSDLRRLCSYGHFDLKDYLPACREMLCAVGEAHSAFNSTLILQSMGVNAIFIDLSGWCEEETYDLEDKIERSIKDVDVKTELPIVTGYTKCKDGIMTNYDRGYSEITFSKLAIVTNASEGIIHKEYHLSTGDPKLIGEDKVRIIGETNFDIADQLADLGMEAIHPRASKDMASKNISIRVKNAFEPENPGTTISTTYVSPESRVEMILGNKNMMAIEVCDPSMVGSPGYDHKILDFLKKHNVSYVAKNTNANTITHYVDADAKNLDRCLEELNQFFDGGRLRTVKIAMISVTGTNMKEPGLLSKASGALAEGSVNVLGFSQCMRQVNMQFITHPDDFDHGIKVLHKALVEDYC